MPTESALADTGAERQASVTHALPPVGDAAAVAAFRKDRPADFWVFGEAREKPISRRDAVPAAWLNQPELHLARFDGTAQPGEFYVFQLGVWAGDRALEGVTLEFSGLKGQSGEIPAAAIRCFNLGGVDLIGQPLKKTVAVPSGHVQALWIGVDVPKNASGRYEGTVTIAARGVLSTTVKLELEVKGEVLSDHGDADAARLARLRWLDSTIGIDDQHVVKPFIPLKREGRRCPDSLDWRWDTAKFQDAYYVGAVNGGLQLRFKGDNYIKPFVNVYYKYHQPLHPVVLGQRARAFPHDA